MTRFLSPASLRFLVLFTCGSGLWGQARAHAQLPQEAPAAAEVRITGPVEVTIWNRPLVTLRASIGDVTPENRAERIRERIENLSFQTLGGTVRAEMATVGGLRGILVTVDESPVIGLLPQDVDPELSETLEEVGRSVEARLTEILAAQREQQRPRHMLQQVGLVALATLLFVAFCFGLLRLRGATLGLQARWSARPLVVHGFDLWTVLGPVVSGIVNASTLVVLIIASQSWLAFALTRFPYTRPWGESLRSYLLSLLTTLGLGALRSVPGLFAAGLIFVAAKFLSRVASSFFAKVARGELKTSWLEADTARATHRIVNALIWIFAVTAAYPYLPGSETDAFKGVSVFVGLMVSLGGVGFVNQVMSGLVVVYARTFKIGDWVRVGEIEGVVREIGALSTKILTRTREEVTIPNAVLVGTTVTNYSRFARGSGATVYTTVTIGYDTPWRQVHALLERAARETLGVRQDPPPTVLQRALSDFFVEYQLVVNIEAVDKRARVLSDLHASIQDVFNEFGVQIMSPHFRDQPAEKVVVSKENWTPAPAQTPAATEA